MRPPARRAQELARTFAGRPEQDTRAVVRLKTFCAAISTAPPNLPGMPMSHLLSRELWADARHYQIAALATLLVFNLGWLDFGAKPLNSALAIGSALATQILCSRTFGLPQIDLRSPLITGLSLSLLLRADEPWLHALA